MKPISEYCTRFEASSEEQKVQAIVRAFACLVFSISAIVTCTMAIEGLSQGFPFVASTGLLLFSLVLTMLAIAIPSIARLWLR
jgi:uncharacterized membrane protein